MESTGNGVVDFGRFLTGFFVVMGIGKSISEKRAASSNGSPTTITLLDA
jgi:hypothetical protein